MAAPIQNPAKCEVRSVIRFLHGKGQRPADIHKEIVSVYWNIMNRQNRTEETIRALGHHLGGKSFHDDDEIKDVEMWFRQQAQEERSKKLEQNLKKADEWKQKGDDLLYSMIPKAVALRLRNGEDAIETCEWDPLNAIFISGNCQKSQGAKFKHLKEGKFVLCTFRSKRTRVLNQSRQNDRLRVMLVLVHIDITPPHTSLPVFRRIGERTIPYSWRAYSNLSLEESELQEFEEFFYLNAKFNDKLDELNVQNQGRTQNSVASSITSNSNVSNFRLPKLSIPQFNGHFKDWVNFKDLFVSTVHSQVSISNVEKFQYLKGLLTNEPASLIKHMPISNDSYEEAWQKLLDRYDNKKQIVQSLIKTFLDQKPISEANCFNLRKLLDTSDECLRGLNALGEQASSKDCWLIYLLLQKIDPESRRLWAIKSSEEEFPNMKAFLDFLNVRCSSLELMSNNESECKIPIRKRVVNILGLKRKSSKISLRGIAGVTAGQTKGCVDLVIGSQSSNERLEVNAFILNKVTSQIPSEFLDVKDLDYLKSIPLSDEEFMSPKECDIILGSDCF
ncbi:uncharacterized protein TNCV_4073801 [Trichonephila clavipes]|uniref:guanylate cyclase n=1 Tax=Trichonephila clavipes TaxID=2585209 RepID=A0A8X6W829_TRICX|nr:uncharacterized protein TNCV_4073801 [Trichonephila clavipes]